MGAPARGYSWPPFTPGNHAATRHGVWSARKVDPVAAELATGLLAERPDLEAYPETVMAWARAEARCLLLADYVTERGLVAPDGAPLPALRFVVQFERLAADLRTRLGLDPRSEAELAKVRAEAVTTAVDLDALRQRGREARLAAEKRLALEAGRGEPTTTEATK